MAAGARSSAAASMSRCAASRVAEAVDRQQREASQEQRGVGVRRAASSSCRAGCRRRRVRCRSWSYPLRWRLQCTVDRRQRLGGARPGASGRAHGRRAAPDRACRAGRRTSGRGAPCGPSHAARKRRGDGSATPTRTAPAFAASARSSCSSSAGTAPSSLKYSAVKCGPSRSVRWPSRVPEPSATVSGHSGSTRARRSGRRGTRPSVRAQR